MKKIILTLALILAAFALSYAQSGGKIHDISIWGDVETPTDDLFYYEVDGPAAGYYIMVKTGYPVVEQIQSATVKNYPDLYLGATREEALKTLNDLLNIILDKDTAAHLELPFRQSTSEMKGKSLTATVTLTSGKVFKNKMVLNVLCQMNEYPLICYLSKEEIRFFIKTVAKANF